MICVIKFVLMICVVCFRAGGEDDFEMFLESVKARSLAARTRAIASQGMYMLSGLKVPVMHENIIL